MSATIITNFLNSYEFEPEIVSDNGRDGISAFQFKVIGKFSSLLNAFQIDESVSNVPDQPQGAFVVVRRNLEHIAGDTETGLYRLSVSCEGGTGDSNLFISESSYSMQNQQVQGIINLPLAQLSTQYNLIWLYPSVTITTNSKTASPSVAESKAREIIKNFSVSIIKDRPASTTGRVSGPYLSGNSDLELVYITGSSVEKAGGLYRVRATASKGIITL